VFPLKLEPLTVSVPSKLRIAPPFCEHRGASESNHDWLVVHHIYLLHGVSSWGLRSVRDTVYERGAPTAMVTAYYSPPA
jgi:hypothetical protein